MATQTARLIPHGAAASPLGLHLVLGEEPPQGGPVSFQALSTEDDMSRVLVAMVKGDDQTIIEFCALKILPNSFATAPAGAGSDLTNASLEERWDLERSRLSRLRSEGSFFPRIFQFQFADAEDQRRLPPLFFCKPGGSFFVPPCPRCFTPLATCRDDALLVSHGLPPYTSSLERFLYCSACAVRPESLVLYSFAPTPAHGRLRVGSPSDLMEEIGRGLAGDWPEKRVEAFPCACCRDAARSPKSNVRWAERWSPFSFYDTPYIVTGLSPLNLDELSDLLGGRPWETFLDAEPAARGAGSPPLRHAWIGTPVEKTSGFLFGHDGSGMDAVETLFLKMTAFRQLVQGLVQFHRLVGKPHLDIHPRHVLFDLHGSGEGLPVLWSFHARLHGLATAAQALPLEGAPSAVLPPRNPAVPFAPQEVIEYQLAGPRPAEVVFSDLGEGRLQGRLTDPYGLFPDPRERDLILLMLPGGGVDLGLGTLAVRVQGASPAGSTFRTFVSEPLRLDDAAARRVRKTLGVRLAGVRYKVYPDFGAPSDLYSLGVVLLGLLLSNDGQDIGAILKALGRVLPAPRSEDAPAPAMKTLLARAPEAASVFAPANVFYSSVDRGSSRANAIPGPLWDRVLMLAMRLAGRVEGFSLCRDHTDFDPAFPAAKIEWVLEEATLISTELKSLLFSRQSINLEVQQVLAEILSEESPNSPG